jgi:hypothetical protein
MPGTLPTSHAQHNIQREAVLRELRDHRSGHLDSLRVYTLHPDKYREDDHRLTREKMAVVERALDYAEGTEPGRPFDLVAPIWFAQSITDNSARIAIEDLAGTIDALQDGRMPDGAPVGDARAAIRRAMKEVRIWTKALLAAYEYPHQPYRHR